MREGGVSSNDVLGSGTSVIRGNSLVEDLDLQYIEVKTTILVKCMMQLVNLKGIAQLSINISLVA